MTDVSGIPNLGFGGGAILGGNAATGQPAMSSAQIMASLYGNYSPGQAQSTLNNIYGAQGFGGQTAQYAAQGAAYGRAVPSLAGGFPNTPAGYAAARGGGIGSDAARAPMGSTFEQRFAPAPQVNPTLQPQAGGYLPQGMYDGVFAPTQPPKFSHSFNERFNAAPAFDPDSFANRFGAGGYYNPGQPSQYAPGARMPPGFSQPYDVDNPGGALPLRPGQNWYGGPQGSS